MRGSPDEYMTVGILQAAAFPAVGALTALRQIVATGCFGAVETTVALGCDIPAAREVLQAAGLVVDYDAGAALYDRGASLCSLDELERERSLHITRVAIDAACALGASRLSLISGRDPGEPHRGRAMDVLVDSILALYDYARATSALELSLKMADRAVDKYFLIGPTCDGVAVARRVRERYPAFGLVLNLSHLPLLREDAETAVYLAAPYLARVHIGNCVVARGDAHPRFGVPGSAIEVADVSRFLRALVSIGYLTAGGRNVVAFEVRPAADEEQLEVLAESNRTLCEAWAQV